MYITFQGISDAEPDKTSRWVGGADCYLAVWGEYERCGASWSFRKVLREASSYKWDYNPRSGTLEARLHVSGRTVGTRYRPTHWYLSIECERRQTLWKTSGKCKSVKEGLRKADEVLTAEVTRTVLQKLYQHSLEMESVYQLKPEVTREMDKLVWYDKEDQQRKKELFEDGDNWEPWMTLIGIEWSHFDWPPGYYLSFNSQGRGWIHNRGTYGTSSSSITVPPPPEDTVSDIPRIYLPYFSRLPDPLPSSCES